jgi:hypothetical protein
LHRSTKFEFFSDRRTKNDDDDHRTLQHHVWRIAQKIKGGMPLYWRLKTAEIKLDRRNNAANRLQWRPRDQKNECAKEDRPENSPRRSSGWRGENRRIN